MALSLDYMSGGTDERSPRRLALWLAKAETATRWIAVAALVGTHWEWFSLRSPLSMICALAAIAGVPLWLIILCMSRLQSRLGGEPLRWGRRRIAIGLCALAGLSGASTPWPFYVAFTISKPFLNRLADNAAAGMNVGGSHWAGGWLITQVRVEPDGSVGMYFDWNGSGWCGVVRYASPTSPRVSSNNGRLSLGGNWELVDED